MEDVYASVYNLVAFPKENTNTPLHVANKETELNLRSIVQEWKSKAQKIKKIGYQLEHRYTNQSIGFSTLKGRDEIVLATLRNAKDCNGKKLLHVSILLMEHYCNRRGDEIEDQRMKPYKLMEENVDGSIKTTTDNDENFDDNEDEDDDNNDGDGDNDNNIDKWDMECFSKNGWWVMPNVVVKHGDILTDDDDKVRGRHEIEKSNDDNEEHDDDSCIRDDDENEIEQNRQMFLTWNEYVKKEQGYNGNEGGSIETWYYAAAIIISPCTDVTLN
jgi:hypothetical protein